MRINWISDSWKRVKNHCRTTVNKSFTDNEPTDDFKKKLLISEHSPIRLLEIDWTWENIKYWVSTEWSRHKFEKFITSQRDDRMIDETPRDKKTQDALVNYDGYANAQNTIDAWRKRLCYQATPEARKLAEEFKCDLHNIEPEWADVLQKNCIYRAGCPEFKSCGYWENFVKNHKNEDLLNIQTRYDLANKEFYESRINKNEHHISPETLKKLNKFTRREMSEEEVYIFDVILCDNDIDRDGERFSLNALKSLEKLFVGKTGFVGYDIRHKTLTARIFSTELVTDNSKTTAAGEPYTYLKGSAYMVRTDENLSLIREIDGGIKKEVSISCSAKSRKCSVCGADLNRKGCPHTEDEDKNVHIILDEITDAYEWSFVTPPIVGGN